MIITPRWHHNAITMMDSQEIVEDETLFRDLELENTNTIMDSQQKNEDDNQKADSIHNAVENSYEIINNEGINIRGFDTDSDIEPLTSQDAIICGTRIPLDVVTRWNSKFLMISIINKNIDVPDMEAMPYSVRIHNKLRRANYEIPQHATDEIDTYLKEEVASPTTNNAEYLVIEAIFNHG
ncbi:unnamed protein product [Gordionus sp. m RMFG-2023]